MRHTTRRPLSPTVDDAPTTLAAPERRLVLGLISRAILDACASPKDLAWLQSEAFATWCGLVDLPPGRLRQAVADDPQRVKKYARMLGHSA